MTPITVTIRGLAGIVVASALICRLGALYGDKIRAALDDQERLAYDQLMAACAVFDATKPLSSD